MLNFLTGLVGPVSNIATTFLKNKAAVSQAKHEAKMSVIQNDANWEAHMAQASASSWKDEFFVIVLSIPLILAFIPGAEGIVDRGFEQLHKAPDWYFYSLGIAISASFGVKGYKQFTRRK